MRVKREAPVRGNDHVCRCGKEIKGNINHDRVEFCGACVMLRALARERMAETAVDGVPEEGRIKRRRTMRIKKNTSVCSQCGQSFKKKSKAQRFCSDCHNKKAESAKNASVSN